MLEKCISLAGQTLKINYPHQAAGLIDFSFANFHKGVPGKATTSFTITLDEKNHFFSVTDNGQLFGTGLDDTDLALLLLTRSIYILAQGITRGMAVHAAAVERNNKIVLMPGNIGTGKSILTSWLLSLGFTYLTDELVCFTGDGSCNPLKIPLYINQSSFDKVEDFVQLHKQQHLCLSNGSGTLFSHTVFSDVSDTTASQSNEIALLLFIEYSPDAPLSLDAISPALAAQRLMGCIVNGRRIRMQGVSEAAALTRNTPALVLQYADLSQLDDVLEPIIDFVTDTGCSPASLQQFITAFQLIAKRQPPVIQYVQEPVAEPVPVFPVPEATPQGGRKKLTIGMATYDDYDGLYFSIQALQMYHPEIIKECEILVIDNHPDGPCAESLKNLEKSVENYRYLPVQELRGTAVRDYLFRHAVSEYVLCMDCHVFLVPGALKKLMDYFAAHPDSNDLLQGPMVYDDMKQLSTHFNPEWKAGMYGTWGHDSRADDCEGEPFDIPMQGLGLFACRKESWLGFNPRFYGFGGEEGYIHEKVRQAGGRTQCLPFLRWMHRFARPMGVPYPIHWKERIHNYMVGFEELGLSVNPVKDHFAEVLGKEPANRIYEKLADEMNSPFHFFDAIYCITMDTESERWHSMQKRFQTLGIDHRVRIFNAIKTPENHHIGCAMSHRKIIALAQEQKLSNVLVFEDDAIFLDNTLEHLQKSVSELQNQKSWNIFYLGGHTWGGKFAYAAGCSFLRSPYRLSCTHALAYNNSVYDRILQDLPDTVEEMKELIKEKCAIDQYLPSLDGLFLASPVVASQPPLLPQEKTEHRHRFTLGETC